MTDEDVLELGGTFHSLKRRGPWAVPKVIRIRQRIGSVIVDFRQATFSQPPPDQPPPEQPTPEQPPPEQPASDAAGSNEPTVTVELDLIGASVGLRLPANGTVDTTGLKVLLGTVKDDWVSTGTTAQGPHVVVTGRIIWGSLVTRRKD